MPPRADPTTPRPMLPSPGRRRICAAAVGASLATLAALSGFSEPVPAQTKPALAFQLITPAEAQRERETRAKDEPELRTRSLTVTPSKAGFAIRVVAPNAQGSVSAPLRIELVFEVPAGTKVVPSTFRVLYGVMKLDLTERLKRFATITERGVVVEQAVIPDGLHRLLVSVADEQGNVASQELRIRVGAAS
jgi:hypothetical protein